MNHPIASPQIHAKEHAILPTPVHSGTHPHKAPQKAGNEPLQVNNSVQISVCVVSLLVTFATFRNEVGWQLGIGLLFVLGAHELGHMAVAAYHGISVTWPIFIPYIGGFVIPLGEFKDAKEEAYVALGGPVVGLFANAILHAIGVWQGSIPVLSLAIFCYALQLVNMIPAGMLDGGRVAGFIGRRLWLPGLLGLGWIAYKYSSDSLLELLVALWVLLPAANRARIVLLEWIRKDTEPVLAHRQPGFYPVAGITLGVLLFGVGGLLLAQKQRHDIGLMRWLDAFVDDPRNWTKPPADSGGETAGLEELRPCVQ